MGGDGIICVGRDGVVYVNSLFPLESQRIILSIIVHLVNLINIKFSID